MIKKMTALVALVAMIFQLQAAPQGTAFTYQGELIDNNQPANGFYDFNIVLYDAPTGGNVFGSQFFPNVEVTDGVFTLTIDVGDIPFSGDENWIEMDVLASGSPGNFVTLSPRTLITNSPYAIQAQYIAANGVNSLSIQDGQIFANDIANDNITTAKLAHMSVTADKIANDAVNSAIIANGSILDVDIQAGAVNNTHLSNNSVTSNKILNGSITAGKVALGAIGSAEIADGSIIGLDLMNNSIDTVQLANDAVTNFDMADDAVGSNEIINGSIGSIDINTSQVQARVTGSCAAGSSIRTIAIDGTVTCEPDDSGSAGWSLTGNSGTTPTTHFIGTTDNKPFELRVDNRSAFRVVPTSFDEAANFVGGHFNNSIDSGVHGAAIMGGGNFSFFNRISEHNGFIGGGRSNIIGDGDTNFDEGSGSLITGGYNNTVTGQLSSITGGTSNQISGNVSIIAGGQSNQITDNYGFAAGYGSKVNHIGSWVWNDFSDANPNNSLATTADHQFLIRATGGVGIGTNAPGSPVHVVGQGTSSGSTAGSNEVVMTIQPKDNANNVALALNSLDNLQDAALIFAKSGVPEYDIRNYRNNGFEFSHYDANNGLNKTTMMRLISTPSQNRADFNVDIEPESNGNYNLGAPGFRWNTIYALNPVDVSSDRRLKKNIQTLEYGLPEVLAMRPVSYGWKNQDHSAHHLGLIAQDVEQIIPEIVSAANDDEQTRSMRYTELIPVLIKATQEQQQLIDQQAAQIKSLQDMLEKLAATQ